MTTIAWDGHTLAADTLLTAGGMRAGHTAKIRRFGSLLIGFCGKSTNFEAFRNWLAGGAVGNFKGEGGNVFILPPTGPAIIWPEAETPWREESPFWALGDGEAIALGVMASGGSAVDAVKAAISISVYSGGDITALRRIST